MSRVNRILVIIFVLFLVVTMAEIVFYFFYKPKVNVNNSSIPLKILISPIPTNLTSIISPVTLAVKPETLQHLSILLNRYKKGVLTTSILNSQIEGEVINISTDEWVSPEKKVYKASIFLKSNTNQNQSNTIFFDQQELDNMIIFSVSKVRSSRKPLNFSGIAKGDYVIIRQKVDLLQSDFLKGIGSTELEVYKR